MKKLSDTQAAKLQPVLIKLVSTEEDNVGRRVLLPESVDSDFQAALDMFVSKQRLLVRNADVVSKQPTVEVAHEAVITVWPRLKRLAEEYRDFRRWHEREFYPYYRLWRYDKKSLLSEEALKQSQQLTSPFVCYNVF
jgi:ribosomal protein S21